MNTAKFKLNGEMVHTESDLSMRLLDVIRNDFGLTGTKEGCAEGECGACLVYLDDEVVNSCIVPLSNVVDREVITIEGFSKTERYKSIENAFLESGGVQCGFCTPGMVLAIDYLFRSYDDPSEEDIKEGLSGNLCRCTGYQGIFEAVEIIKKGGGIK